MGDRERVEQNQIVTRNASRMTGEAFDSWVEGLASLSPKSRSLYLRGMEQFLEYSGLDCDGIIALHSEDIKESYPQGRTPVKLAKKVRACIKDYTDVKGKSQSHAKSIKSAVTSFMKANGYEGFAVGKNGGHENGGEAGSDNISPSELRTVVELAPDLQQRALLLVGKDAGLRLGDVLSLTYEDVKAGLESEFYQLEKVTEKTNSRAQPVLGFESLRALKQLVAYRRGRGEDIRDDSPLFVAYRLKDEGSPKAKSRDRDERAQNLEVKGSTPWGTNAASITMSRLFTKAGLVKVTFHGLRKLHSTYLELGEHKLSEPMIARMEGRTIRDSRQSYKRYPVGELTKSYTAAYPNITVFGGESKQVAELTDTLKAQADEVQVLRSQLDETSASYEARIKELEGRMISIMGLVNQAAAPVQGIKDEYVKIINLSTTDPDEALRLLREAQGHPEYIREKAKKDKS